MLLGLGLGGALSAAFRPRSRSRRLALGLNLAAAALVGVVLSGLEWYHLLSLGFASGAGLALGLVACLYPRAVGVPLIVLTAALAWLTAQAVQDFRPLSSFSGPRVQPLTDRETITAFVLRVDFLEPPEGWEVVPALYRVRTSEAEPPEWWWTAVASRGWARSVGAPLPSPSLKFGVYRLVLHNGDPAWSLLAP